MATWSWFPKGLRPGRCVLEHGVNMLARAHAYFQRSAKKGPAFVLGAFAVGPTRQPAGQPARMRPYCKKAPALAGYQGEESFELAGHARVRLAVRGQCCRHL